MLGNGEETRVYMISGAVHRMLEEIGLELGEQEDKAEWNYASKHQAKNLHNTADIVSALPIQ